MWVPCVYCLLPLSETASNREKQHFLGFASFLSGLGPHPFLPKLLGVISAQPPLAMVMEELQHQNLLAYLWKCRQVEASLYADDCWRFNQTGDFSAAHFNSRLNGGGEKKLIPWYLQNIFYMFSRGLSPTKDGSSGPSHDITAQRIFIMGRQVASAVVGQTSLWTLISPLGHF